MQGLMPVSIVHPLLLKALCLFKFPCVEMLWLHDGKEKVLYMFEGTFIIPSYTLDNSNISVRYWKSLSLKHVKPKIPLA